MDLSMRPPEMDTGFITPSETRLLIEDNPSVSKVHFSRASRPLCATASRPRIAHPYADTGFREAPL